MTRMFPYNVLGLRSQFSGLRSQVSGLRSQVSGLRSQVSALRSDVSGLTSQVSGIMSQGACLRSQNSGLKSQVSGHPFGNNSTALDTDHYPSAKKASMTKRVRIHFFKQLCDCLFSRVAATLLHHTLGNMGTQPVSLGALCLLPYLAYCPCLRLRPRCQATILCMLPQLRQRALRLVMVHVLGLWDASNDESKT